MAPKSDSERLNDLEHREAIAGLINWWLVIPTCVFTIYFFWKTDFGRIPFPPRKAEVETTEEQK